jgi:hypothetical protein
MDPRKGYELRTPFLGRTVRPFHFAVTISTGVIAASNLTRETVTFLGHIPSNLIGGFALVAATLLTLGWWFRNDWAAEWGLLIATGVWATRAAYIGLTNESMYVFGTTASVVLSLAWAVGAGGAYLLERADHRGVLGE